MPEMQPKLLVDVSFRLFCLKVFTCSVQSSRLVDIRVAPNFVVCFGCTGQCKAINDEGMPHYQRPFMRGRLYLQFSVEFPETGSVSVEQIRALEGILPPRPLRPMTDMELDDCEETTLLDVNIEDEMRRKQQQQQEAYEEDEEASGPRVQCAQQ
jgi:DnaJ-class molecular chaperone